MTRNRLPSLILRVSIACVFTCCGTYSLRAQSTSDGLTVAEQPVDSIVIQGIVTNELGVPISGVSIHLQYECANQSPINCAIETDSLGRYRYCLQDPISTCKKIRITPSKKSEALVGVTTYDLLLIMRHALESKAQEGPMRFLAADVNASASVTLFDAAQLREIILRKQPDFNKTNNDPWRFIDRKCAFSDNFSPFNADMTVGNKLDCEHIITAQKDTTYDFIGIKIGDVDLSGQIKRDNGDKINSSFSCAINTQRIGGNYISVPIQYFGIDRLLACQMGLQFDPKKLRFIAPSSADVEGVGSVNFGLTEVESGKIRFVWLAPMLDSEQMLLSGQTLFNLTFEVLGEFPAGGAFSLVFDDKVLENRVWNQLDQAFEIEAATSVAGQSVATATTPSTVQVNCTPNPTQGAFEMTITPQISGKARVGLFDNNGRMIQLLNTQLVSGQLQTIALNGLEKEPAGLYIWRVFNSQFKTHGQIIKP
jgi:hypothetical protein